MAENYSTLQAARSEAQCLVHGDFRLDNVLYGQGPPAPAMATVDWQTVALGPALTDVAYFLSGALDPETLATHEADLLTRYRNGLAERGVEPAEDWVAEEYALGSPAGYVMAVVASQIVGQTERGDEMFLVMASGSAALGRRLDVAARLASA
ncbi:MAG: phosphotransferase [Actinomycetota bacterium]